MKILHYINNLGSGGAEKLLTDILPLLEKKGHEVHLLVSNHHKSVPKFQEIVQTSNVHCIDLGYSFYNPFQVLSLIKVIRKNNYDIVHAHLFPSQYWLAFASFFISKKVRYIKTEHSVYNERKSINLLRYLEKMVYSRYHRIIAITDLVKANLSEWLNEDEKIVVIENGVNLSQMQSIKDSDLDGVKIVISQNNFSILMVGRFDADQQKDQQSLVDAMKFLPTDCKLYLVGEGENIENVRQSVRDQQLEERVVFLGLRTDVYQLMKAVNLNVLSTNHEGLSGVALESLASGTPFIGSNVVGVKDVVPNEEFLFPPKNPRELATKILQIKNDKELENKLVSVATEFITKYDISNMVENYLNLYKSVL